MKTLLLIYCFVFFTAPSHDAAIAMFKIYEEGEKTQLYISVDAKDISKEMGVSIATVKIEEVNAYFTRNFSVHVDSKLINYSVDEISFAMDHLKVMASFQSMPKHFHSFEINNTCLADVEGHSNIVQLDISNKTKDFRMHKGRSQIVVSY